MGERQGEKEKKKKSPVVTSSRRLSKLFLLAPFSCISVTTDEAMGGNNRVHDQGASRTRVVAICDWSEHGERRKVQGVATVPETCACEVVLPRRTLSARVGQRRRNGAGDVTCATIDS